MFFHPSRSPFLLLEHYFIAFSLVLQGGSWKSIFKYTGAVLFVRTKSIQKAARGLRPPDAENADLHGSTGAIMQIGICGARQPRPAPLTER